MGPFLETPGLVRLKSQNENEETDSKTKANKKIQGNQKKGNHNIYWLSKMHGICRQCISGMYVS